MTRIGRDEHLVTLMSEISSIMTEQQISQAELARRMNAHPASVSKILSLKVDPRASTLVSMLKALNCHLTMTADAINVAS
jgi:transcriptional regulator with XRE-family HTH domain